MVAAAPKVQNRIPEGSNWDGKDDTGSDGSSAQQLLSGARAVEYAGTRTPRTRGLSGAMAQLSEWLQLMLAEIARKQQEQCSAVEEQQARQAAAKPQDREQRKAAQSG